MRKISAHFCLLPDGSVGRMPVISVDDSGIITGIVLHGNSFREEPELEYFGGVLVPGFIEDLRRITERGAVDNKLLNLLYAHGSLRFVCDEGCDVFPHNFKGKVFYNRIGESDIMQPGFSGRSFWEIIKEEHLREDKNVLELISRNLQGIKDLLPEEHKWGVLEKGADPGILLIKGLDTAGMKLRDNTKIIIIVP